MQSSAVGPRVAEGHDVRRDDLRSTRDTMNCRSAGWAGRSRVAPLGSSWLASAVVTQLGPTQCVIYTARARQRVMQTASEEAAFVSTAAAARTDRLG